MSRLKPVSAVAYRAPSTLQIVLEVGGCQLERRDPVLAELCEKLDARDACKIGGGAR